MIQPEGAAYPQFGRYVVVAKWARGGMADIYVARQVFADGLSKPVALKLLLEDHAANDELQDMFLAEARTSVLLTHPHIVQTFDCGEIDGRSYMAMELVNGEPLTAVRRAVREALPLPMALGIVRDVASALDYAHSLHDLDGNKLDLVHRDVSPSNVMLSHDGNVKLLDFGVAKVASKAEHTRSGTIKGKFGYMSPEQARAERVDNRSDLFALGIILWEFITNRRAFRGEDSAALLHAVANTALGPPSKVAPRCDFKLDAIVMRAVAPDRDKRYATGREFADAISAYMAKTAPGYDGPGEIRKLMAKHFSERDKMLRQRLQAPTLQEAVPGAIRPTVSGAWNLQRGGTSSTLSPSLKTSDRYFRSQKSATDSVSVAGSVQSSVMPSQEKSHLVLGIFGVLVAGILAVAAYYAFVSPSTRTLRVTSDQAETMVLVDGVEVGIAPVKLDVPVGREVKVTLRKDGYVESKKTVAAGSDSTSLQVALAQLEQSGTLIVKTTPAGATVVLDGRTRKQQTPAEFSGLWMGDAHRVLVTLPGHEPFVEDVDFTTQPRRTIEVALKSTKSGFLNARCLPGPCELYVNGERVATTPVEKQAVLVGRTLKVELRKDDQVLFARRWSFTAGQARRIEYLSEDEKRQRDSRHESRRHREQTDTDTQSTVSKKKDPVVEKPVEAPVESSSVFALPVGPKESTKPKEAIEKSATVRKGSVAVSTGVPGIRGGADVDQVYRLLRGLGPRLLACHEKVYEKRQVTGTLSVSASISRGAKPGSIKVSGSLAGKMAMCAVRGLHGTPLPETRQGFQLQVTYTFSAR